MEIFIVWIDTCMQLIQITISFFINVIQELFIWQIPVLQKKELIYPIFMAWMNQVTRYI